METTLRRTWRHQIEAFDAAGRSHIVDVAEQQLQHFVDGAWSRWLTVAVQLRCNGFKVERASDTQLVMLSNPAVTLHLPPGRPLPGSSPAG